MALLINNFLLWCTCISMIWILRAIPPYRYGTVVSNLIRLGKKIIIHKIPLFHKIFMKYIEGIISRQHSSSGTVRAIYISDSGTISDCTGVFPFTYRTNPIYDRSLSFQYIRKFLFVV